MAFDPVYNRPVGRKSAQGDLIAEFFIEEAFQGIYSGTNLIYAGFAKPGANQADQVWQISKIAYDGSNNPISITWPVNAGNVVSNDYEFIWNNGVINYSTYTYA